MISFGRLSAIVSLLALALLLAPSCGSPLRLGEANTGSCSGQGSTDAFGTVYWGSSCTVTSTQTWGNGTLTISGSLSISSGATLTLWSMVVSFASTGDLQRSFDVGGGFVMEHGTLRSNDTFHWSMTSSGGSAQVRIEHANITGAGSGSTFGLVLTGGGGNRLAYDTISGVNGKVLGTNGDYVGYSNISNYDDSVLNQHMWWIGANGTFEHNTMWNITVGEQSAVTNYQTYGNATFFANTLYLRANGNNAMGFEIINDQAAQVDPIYPGKWVVRLTWNNVTWYYTAAGSDSHSFDNEFSERIYIANNTVRMGPGTRGTECLQAGGLTASLLEYNTCYGPVGYCIYEYIYENAGNLFQANRCDDAAYGGIFQTGGNVYRSNAFTSLTAAGIWICPNASCAGADTTNTSNNAWYNNTFTFATNPAYLTQMSLGNAFYNTFLGHGAGQWTDGSNQHPVYGDWLFFANAPISHLAFSNAPTGHRTLTVMAGGRTYWDTEPLPGITDAASLAVDGAIDYHGSVNGGTVLSSLYPRGTTALDVTGTGPTTFTFHGYVSNSTYNVTTHNVGTGAYGTGTVTMDENGTGQFGLDLGSGSHYALTISGSFPFPGDTTPPAQVADLRAAVTAPRYVVLAWTAPGDNGSVGQASQYDLRLSASGPLDNASFSVATRVTTLAPRLAGETESVNVSGLLPQTEYWFALRTADAVPNWSPISNEVSVTTAGVPPPAPAVSSAHVDLSALTLDVLFTVQMNRASVNASLGIAPTVAYHVVWVDDGHLRIIFDGALVPGAEYAVTIASTATSLGGQSLGTGFVYRFTVPTSGPTGPPPFPWLLLAAAVVLSASLAALLFVRYGTPPGWGTNWRLRLRRRLPRWMRWKRGPDGPD